ncbi:GNAT superfamily N-acetyltransferase [Evansella vedderi]|uniref:GNAT superfamily N-acetyltransferase n=1 Tax=Evansella vedderi TaxID=38282 RepID=A0ABT9ZVJ8_9BACI|nr:GNAT family N-acetyltransferase [Evansella vedderi]MDQ0255271.1 GNAT superfamily N-acetyltransferase [Evansella vedderi]
MIIRQARHDDWKGIAQVHVDCMHSAYQEFLPSDVLDKFTYANREKRWEKDLPKAIGKGTMTFVVENKQGEIVGFALGGTMRDPRLRISYIGELYGIYVHPDFQGQGFGKKLLETVAQHLASLDLPSMALWTFKGHPSCSFFESLGGEKVYDKKTTIAGKELKEYAYGWDDLKSFSVAAEGLN